MAENKTNSNEAAFARPFARNGEEWSPESDGLTKREYFAAMALQGLLSDAKTINETTQSIVGIPQLAAIAADKLIEALNAEVSA